MVVAKKEVKRFCPKGKGSKEAFKAKEEIPPQEEEELVSICPGMTINAAHAIMNSQKLW